MATMKRKTNSSQKRYNQGYKAGSSGGRISGLGYGTKKKPKLEGPGSREYQKGYRAGKRDAKAVASGQVPKQALKRKRSR
jgi:hypothetical protein